MRYLFAILTLLLFSAQVFSQTYTGDEKEINHILKNSAAFSQYVINAEYDKIANSYTKDGKIFPNNLEIIAGRELIRKYWVLPEGVRTIAHKVTADEIKILGNEAYDYGHYEGKTKRADGQVSTWRGKYLIVWKKVDGDWKMYLDIWNNIRD